MPILHLIKMMRKKTEADRKFENWFAITGIATILLSVLFASFAQADEMVHKFKSPSFSGVGTSAHYLTIENQEFNRKEAIKAEIKAYNEKLARDAENTIEYVVDETSGLITLKITDSDGNTTEITVPIGSFTF
jgi:hypothetical protein